MRILVTLYLLGRTGSLAWTVVRSAFPRRAFLQGCTCELSKIGVRLELIVVVGSALVGCVLTLQGCLALVFFAFADLRVGRAVAARF